MPSTALKVVLQPTKVHHRASTSVHATRHSKPVAPANAMPALHGACGGPAWQLHKAAVCWLERQHWRYRPGAARPRPHRCMDAPPRSSADSAALRRPRPRPPPPTAAPRRCWRTQRGCPWRPTADCQCLQPGSQPTERASQGCLGECRSERGRVMSMATQQGNLNPVPGTQPLYNYSAECYALMRFMTWTPGRRAGAPHQTRMHQRHACMHVAQRMACSVRLAAGSPLTVGRPAHL